MIQFVVPGVIQPKARTRMNSSGKLYLPSSTARCQTTIAWLAKQAARDEDYREGRVAFWIALEERQIRGDLDNKIKTILDGCQDGDLIRNDSQVDEIHILRHRSARDLCAVAVARPGEFPRYGTGGSGQTG